MERNFSVLSKSMVTKEAIVLNGMTWLYIAIHKVEVNEPYVYNS